jgi:quinol monooxygenase YgiN
VTVVEIIQIPVAPEDAGDLAATIHQARDGYLAPPRCEQFEVLRGDGEIAVVVRWASASAHGDARESDASGPFLAKVGDLAAAAPSLALYELG